MKATKRPWEVVPREDGTFDIWTKAGETPYTIHIAIVRRLGNGLQKQGKAHARLIVKAVNLHDELVEALEGYVKAVEMFERLSSKDVRWWANTFDALLKGGIRGNDERQEN